MNGCAEKVFTEKYIVNHYFLMFESGSVSAIGKCLDCWILSPEVHLQKVQRFTCMLSWYSLIQLCSNYLRDQMDEIPSFKLDFQFLDTVLDGSL